MAVRDVLERAASLEGQAAMLRGRGAVAEDRRELLLAQAQGLREALRLLEVPETTEAPQA